MLKELRRIIQAVNAAEDVGTALRLVVQHVKEAFETDACSLFLVDEEKNEYVLIATEGLNPKQVGKFRLNLNEGLVGLVGEREEPINLAIAKEHERFQSSSAVGEEKYSAFLGVPVLHQRELLGILVVQQQEARRFDESEAAFLVTLAAQIAATLAHAKTTGDLTTLGKRKRSKKIRGTTFGGIAGASGVAIGQVVVVYPPADLDAVPDRDITNVSKELKIFEAALLATREEIAHLYEYLTASLPAEEREVFAAYSRILESPSLVEGVQQEIKNKQWAQGAVKRVIRRYLAQFTAMDDTT